MIDSLFNLFVTVILHLLCLDKVHIDTLPFVHNLKLEVAYFRLSCQWVCTMLAFEIDYLLQVKICIGTHHFDSC